MRLRPLAAAALALALAGCPFHPRQPVPGPREGEWSDLRAAATRRVTLYDGLEHRATATATHLGLPEREARVRRLAAWYGWTAAELDARLATERAEAAAGEEFLLALYTANGKQNDLDAPRSIWRVAVRTDEGELLASKIEVLDVDATLTGLFPYVGTFDVVYRVRFPSASPPLEGRPYVLAISSALGKMDLDFGATPEASRLESDPDL